MNKSIVAGLQAKGVNAIGLTGADMNVICSVKRPVKDVDYGLDVYKRQLQQCLKFLMLMEMKLK